MTTKPEGMAKILSISLHDIHNPELLGYSCDVKFVEDGYKCVRKIYRRMK